MIIICPQCNKEVDKPAGQVNRANKDNLTLYCGRECSGLARRLNKSKEQQIEEKRLYDIKYREENNEKLKVLKSERFKKDYKANPEKYREIRKKKYKKHLEYLNTPEYKEWKRKYDQIYRAKKLYGEFWESAILLFKIELIVDKRQVNFDKGTYNKAQRRKRNQVY